MLRARPHRRRRSIAARLLGALTAACLLPAAGAPASVYPAAATWTADFSTRDFTQWSWWGQGQEELWGHIAVRRALAAGVPPLAADIPYVARMAVSRRDVASGGYHAKLFKSFVEPDASGQDRPPADVSGTYAAWFYIPRRYAMARGSWTNVFQFKETFDHRGERHSDPLWWVQLGRADAARRERGRWIGRPPRADDRPVAFINHWFNPWRRPVTYATVPLGKWFEIRAVVRQARRIDFFLDKRRLDTARASEYPVSPFRSASRGWTFGVGNYSTAPGTALFVTAASFSPYPLPPERSAARAAALLCPSIMPSRSTCAGTWPFAAA